jgi:hypothetical protein
MSTLPAGFDPIPLDDFEPLLLATKEQFDMYWTATKPLLEKCVKRAMHGEMTIDDIYNSALQGKMYIFVVKCDKTITKSVKLALVLEIVHYPKLAAMNIVALGGSDLDALHAKYWKMLCGWAYMNSVRVIEGWVSPAMERVISQYGFKPVYTHMRLELTEAMK